MVKVNAVGMVCPLPVIETRKALKENEQVETTVDNKVATENLRRMAAQMGYEYDLKEEGADRFVVTITKTQGAERAETDPDTATKAADEFVVVIDSVTMGNGAEQLGKNLMKTFIYTLTEQEVLPQRIIFITAAYSCLRKGRKCWKIYRNLPQREWKFTAAAHALTSTALRKKSKSGKLPICFP